MMAETAFTIANTQDKLSLIFENLRLVQALSTYIRNFNSSVEMLKQPENFGALNDI